MAEASRSLEDYQTALDLYRRSIELYRNIGDVWGISRALIQYGECELEMGETEKAQENFTEALEIANRAGASPVIMEALVGFALVKSNAGDSEYALRILAQVLEHPSTNQPTRERASQLYAELEASYPIGVTRKDNHFPKSLESTIADLIAR